MGWELELKKILFTQLSSLAHSRLILSVFNAAIDLQEKYFKLRWFGSKGLKIINHNKSWELFFHTSHRWSEVKSFFGFRRRSLNYPSPIAISCDSWEGDGSLSWGLQVSPWMKLSYIRNNFSFPRLAKANSLAFVSVFWCFHFHL